MKKILAFLIIMLAMPVVVNASELSDQVKVALESKLKTIFESDGNGVDIKLHIKY